jgi:hypothetical protein
MRAAVLALLTACGGVVGDPPIEIAPDAEPIEPDAIPPITLAPDAGQICEGGDARAIDAASGHCIVYVNAIATWNVAQADCVSRGGTLAAPTSAQEVAFVTGLPTMVLTLPDIWLGANDGATEGTFTWITGEGLAYTNWRTGEPNNGGTSGVEEDCMVLEADTAGTWDDRPCGREYPHLCELP